MDGFSLADTPVGDQDAVYEEFKEQLSRNPRRLLQARPPLERQPVPEWNKRS